MKEIEKDLVIRQIRKTDHVGRVLIPLKIREKLGIEKCDSVILDLVKVENDKLLCLMRKEES